MNNKLIDKKLYLFSYFCYCYNIKNYNAYNF